MTIPEIPALSRTSPTFRADLDALFLTQIPATIPAFNAEMERVNQFAFGSYSATSTTSLTIGSGSKTLTVEAGKGFAIGQTVLLASSASPSNYMLGSISAYDVVTGSMSVSVTNTGGSGTYAGWSISVSATLISLLSIQQRTITSADTLVAADHGKLISLNGTFTLGAAAAATLGNGWWCYLRNTGGAPTFDPNAAETVDGATSGIVRGTILLVCNGTSFTATKLGPFTTTEVLTSGTSWVSPLGVRSMRARGQGGSGGKGQGSTAAGGGGGGGFDVVLGIAPSTTYAYAIGAAGVDSASGNGNPGGDTTLTVSGNTYTAQGGNGGGTSAAPIGNGTSATGPGILKMLGGTGFNAAGMAPIYGSGALGYHATSTTGNQSKTAGVLVLEY